MPRSTPAGEKSRVEKSPLVTRRETPAVASAIEIHSSFVTARRSGGPARDEERSRRHRQRRCGGVGVSYREKEGELNPEHPESVENEVAPVPSVAKGSEDVFPQDEGFERKKNARTREKKGGEVDRVKRDRLHEVLRGNAHGPPEDAGGRSERNAEDGARKHEGVSRRMNEKRERALRREHRESETVQHCRADSKTLSRRGLEEG